MAEQGKAAVFLGPGKGYVSHDKYKLADINKAFDEAEWQKDGASATKVRRAVIVS